MIKSLYVIGGQQRAPRMLRDGNGDWNGYERGLILTVDLETEQAEVSLEYVSPPEVCAPEDPAITFQAGTIEDGKLYTCTQTEVLVYALPEFSLITYISLPIFNDLHHVCPTPDGNILVANAGLELVMELTLEGQIVRTWHVLGEAPEEHIHEGVDYRKISTKPHSSHPNYLFYIGEDAWVTRFHQGDAIRLTRPERRIPLSSERIHDGVLYEGRLYFTTVSGKVLIANPQTLQVEETIDVNEMHPPGVLLGWCRSLMVDGDRLWLGFSRIRPTKLRENVSWVMHGFKQVMPTHIACYDLRQRVCVTEIDLETAGLNAIYSIFPAAVQSVAVEV